VNVKELHVAVTGAGTGIGRAIASRLVAEGARVSVLARDVSRLDVGEAHACDIRDPEAVEAVFDRIGPLDALVANAGIGGPNERGPGDRFEDLVATNLTGTYWCMRAAQRHGARHVVVIASILARIGVPGYTGYCASKAGLLGLVRAFAAELGPDGVQVNAICPGWVDTDMAWEGIDGFAEAIGGTREEAYAEAMKAVPLGRMSAPDDIAGTVRWLLSPDARGVTGQAIDQNGGAFML
jgi:NAD(P)-dependent dehydrogenase (short-subunit alcohol dehydrogenase family)